MAVVVGGVVARVCCFACAPPVGNATRFSHGLFGTPTTTKKNGRAADSNSFILACLIEGAHARTLANRQVSVKKEMNGKRPREQETERDKY